MNALSHSTNSPLTFKEGNTMQFESSTTIQASAAHIFSIYADVAQWPSWDPDLKAAKLEGALVSGVVGEVHPHSGPKSKLAFVEVVNNKSLRMECKLPLGMMHFDYELKAQGDTTVATHRTTFSGLLAPLWGRLIGSGMKKSLPAALAGLKRKAEGA
jgi:Polyketide cyclase / dehydrase and lipid transport